MDLTNLAAQTVASLEKLWDEIGEEKHEQNKQKQILFDEVKKIFTEAIRIKQEERDALRQGVTTNSEAIVRITTSFGEPLKLDEVLKNVEPLPLKLKYTKLSEQLADLQKEQSTRQSKLKAMTEEINSIWKALDEPMKMIEATYNTLTTKYLKEVEQLLKEAQQEKNYREKRLEELDNVVASLQEELEEWTFPELDNPLSLASLEALRAEKERLLRLKQEREQIIMKYGEQITKYWATLHISEEEMTEFYARNTKLGPSCIEACKKELERLQLLKQQRLGELIKEKQAEIRSLATELGQEVHLEENPVVTEEVLDELCRRAEDFQKQVARLRPILQLIAVREKLEEEKIAFLNATSDASRLLSKKASSTQRLEEEKQRKAIEKKLKTNEEKLKKAVTEWEAANGDVFFYQGEPYLQKLEADSAKSRSLYTPSKKRAPATPSTPATPGTPKGTTPGKSMKRRPLHGIDNTPTPEKPQKRARVGGLENTYPLRM